MGAQISSNSWGNNPGSYGQREALKASLEANQNNHLFIAAAGNNGLPVGDPPTGLPHFTCSTRAANQICVASSTSSNTRSEFSNYGKEVVHVFAPGSHILSTYPRNSYTYMDGTSMACPHVAGLAALMMSMRGDLKPLQAKELIIKNVQKTNANFANLVMSSGIIDVNKTLDALIEEYPTTTKKPTTLRLRRTTKIPMRTTTRRAQSTTAANTTKKPCTVPNAWLIVGNMICNDHANTEECLWDGGDCCGNNGFSFKFWFCTECLCKDPNYKP